MREDTTNNGHIGGRIKRLRERRGLLRPMFADLCGRSVSWVEKIESGERNIDKLPMLEQVATVLNVTVDDLIGAPARRTLDTFEVSAVRAALQTPHAISSLFLPPPRGGEPIALDVIARHLDHTWASFQNANWSQLGRTLPKLLTHAQEAATAHTGHNDAAIQARALLSRTYQVSASCLFKLKEADLAWIAVERSLTHAETTGDPLLISDAARRVAQGLMANGQHESALNLIRATIDRLEPGRGTGSPAHLSLYGMQFLMGAVIAAKAHKPNLAQDLLTEGHSVARQLGYDGNEHFTAFGPTNVHLHQVSVLIDLGEGDAAARATGNVSLDHLARLPKERRANFHIDIARAHAIAGRSTNAAKALLRADALFPNEIRYRPAATALVGDLLRRTSGSLADDMRQLANRAGVPHG